MQHKSPSRNGAKQVLTTAEKKIIIIFLSVMVFGVYTMVHFGVVTGTTDEKIELLTKYFFCEASGHVPGRCDRKALEQYLYQNYMSIFAYVLLGIIPIAILNFVVNWEKLWKSLKKTVLMTLNDKNSIAMTTSLNNRLTQKNSFVTKQFSMQSLSKGSTVYSP